MAFIAVVGSCAGCIFHSEYPKGWAPVQPVVSGQCPSVAGRFDNDALVSAAPSTYRLWFGELVGIADHGSVVELVDDLSGVLHVRVLIPTRTSPLMGEKAIPYTCGEDGMRLAIGYEFHDFNVGTSVTKKTMHLMRGADGSLVARLTSSDFGLVIAFPAVVSEQRWLRFAPETPRHQREP
jgi:hypothetical protein